jgi:hypothetical protein
MAITDFVESNLSILVSLIVALLIISLIQHNSSNTNSQLILNLSILVAASIPSAYRIQRGEDYHNFILG